MADHSTVTYWIDGVKAGDERATRKLWDRYFHRLTRLAASRLPLHARRDSDEEDVALSAFQSFCGRATRDQFPRLSGHDDVWRLLAVITSRKAIGSLRRRAALKRGGGVVVGESALHESPLLESADAHEAGLAGVLGPDPSPALAAEHAEDYRRLLDSLGDETLRTVALMRLEGRNDDEIAGRLGVSSRTVQRKLRLIRHILEDQERSAGGG
jgi:DNA-directed RNA polymerase specialized sigma24 family protein